MDGNFLKRVKDLRKIVNLNEEGREKLHDNIIALSEELEFRREQVNNYEQQILKYFGEKHLLESKLKDEIKARKALLEENEWNIKSLNDKRDQEIASFKDEQIKNKLCIENLQTEAKFYQEELEKLQLEKLQLNMRLSNMESRYSSQVNHRDEVSERVAKIKQLQNEVLTRCEGYIKELSIIKELVNKTNSQRDEVQESYEKQGEILNWFKSNQNKFVEEIVMQRQKLRMEIENLKLQKDARVFENMQKNLEEKEKEVKGLRDKISQMACESLKNTKIVGKVNAQLMKLQRAQLLAEEERINMKRELEEKNLKKEKELGGARMSENKKLEMEYFDKEVQTSTAEIPSVEFKHSLEPNESNLNPMIKRKPVFDLSDSDDDIVETRIASETRATLLGESSNISKGKPEVHLPLIEKTPVKSEVEKEVESRSSSEHVLLMTLGEPVVEIQQPIPNLVTLNLSSSTLDSSSAQDVDLDKTNQVEPVITSKYEEKSSLKDGNDAETIRTSTYANDAPNPMSPDKISISERKDTTNPILEEYTPNNDANEVSLASSMEIKPFGIEVPTSYETTDQKEPGAVSKKEMIEYVSSDKPNSPQNDLVSPMRMKPFADLRNPNSNKHSENSSESTIDKSMAISQPESQEMKPTFLPDVAQEIETVPFSPDTISNPKNSLEETKVMEQDDQDEIQIVEIVGNIENYADIKPKIEIGLDNEGITKPSKPPKFRCPLINFPQPSRHTMPPPNRLNPTQLPSSSSVSSTKVTRSDVNKLPNFRKLGELPSTSSGLNLNMPNRLRSFTPFNPFSSPSSQGGLHESPAKKSKFK